MATRMIHPLHGATHAYGDDDVKRHKALGWAIEAPITVPVINGDADAPSPQEVIEERQSFPALPGEGPSTPLLASVGVHSVIDQAAIAEERTKRKYTRKAK